jgi:hypothetical protein
MIGPFNFEFPSYPFRTLLSGTDSRRLTAAQTEGNCPAQLHHRPGLTAGHDDPYTGRRRSNANQAAAGDQGDRGLQLDGHGYLSRRLIPVRVSLSNAAAPHLGTP